MAATKDPRSLSSRRVILIQVFCQLYWVLGGVAGVLVGSALPMQLDGLDFALTALFVVLAVDAFRARRDVPAPSGAAQRTRRARRRARPVLVVAMSLFVVALLARFLWQRRRGAVDA